jgi:hypothetical protein
MKALLLQNRFDLFVLWQKYYFEMGISSQISAKPYFTSTMGIRCAIFSMLVPVDFLHFVLVAEHCRLHWHNAIPQAQLALLQLGTY